MVHQLSWSSTSVTACHDGNISIFYLLNFSPSFFVHICQFLPISLFFTLKMDGEKIWCEAVQIINCWSKYFESIFDDRIRWVNIFFSKFIFCGVWMVRELCLSSCMHFTFLRIFYYTLRDFMTFFIVTMSFKDTLRSSIVISTLDIVKYMLGGGKLLSFSSTTVKIALDTQHILFTSSCV